MRSYLLGFCYHEPEAFAKFKAGKLEDFESSTGIFISANSTEEALQWCEVVASNFFHLLNDVPTETWKAYGYFCWFENDPAQSGWQHCLSFFQHISFGILPNFEKMGTQAYIQWQKEHASKNI